MALVLNLILPRQQIRAKQPQKVQLSIQNTGVTDVTISSLQAYLTPSAAAGRITEFSVPPGRSLVIAASATNYYDCDVIFSGPKTQGPPPGAGVSAASCAQYQINATVYSNDATAPVQAAPSLTVWPVPADNYTQGQIATTPGTFDFSQPANSYLYALL